MVENIRQVSIEEPVQPTVYVNNMMNSRVQMTVVARTLGEPLAMAAAVRDAIWSVDREQTITSISTFDQLVGEAVARPRLLTTLLGVFGALGLILGAVGLYGVINYVVTQRTQEIGVRIALGAIPTQVRAMVLRQGLLLGGLGVSLGLAAAFGMTRVLQTLLFEIGSKDPLTFTVVPAVMLSVTLLAVYLPARRASSVSPLQALRGE